MTKNVHPNAFVTRSKMFRLTHKQQIVLLDILDDKYHGNPEWTYSGINLNAFAGCIPPTYTYFERPAPIITHNP
jgi:hypothetical protein